MAGDIYNLIDEIVAFRDARDWSQFHTLKNLAASLSIEAAELLELTQWKSEEELELALRDEDFCSKLSDETADVLIYVLLICKKAGIDPLDAARQKLVRNEKRYPLDKSRGSSKKYTEIE